jgi:hypothetical protein
LEEEQEEEEEEEEEEKNLDRFMLLLPVETEPSPLQYPHS